jgi:hypothetical protein
MRSAARSSSTLPNWPGVVADAQPMVAALTLAPSFLERMQKVAQDFAQQHKAGQKLPEKEREGYTLLLAMRSWEFGAFAALRR